MSLRPSARSPAGGAACSSCLVRSDFTKVLSDAPRQPRFRNLGHRVSQPRTGYVAIPDQHALAPTDLIHRRFHKDDFLALQLGTSRLEYASIVAARPTNQTRNHQLEAVALIAHLLDLSDSKHA